MPTLTSQYALRALIYLAQESEASPIPGREIAVQTEIPAKYLSTILGDLVRAGVLVSSPGRAGGFKFRRSPKKVTLGSVLACFEDSWPHRCPFGNKECSDHNPCLAHDRWKKVVEVEQTFFQRTSIYDIAISESPPAKAKPQRTRKRPKSRRKR